MLGIDVGFGFVKVFPGDIIFPSVFSEYTEREFTMAGNVMDNLEIEADGEKYFIGNLALVEGGTGTFDTFDMLRHKLSILTAISLSTEGDYSGSVVIGLPVSDLKNHKRDLQLLKGTHNIMFCGKKRTIELTDINILPQGASAYFDLILNDEGKASSPLAGKRVGIIDIGEKTLDFVLMDKNRFITDKSGSRDWGMNSAYLKLLTPIHDKLHITCLPHQVREYTSRIEADTKKEYKKLATEIVKGITVAGWNHRDIDVVYLAGGGGIALHKYIAEQFRCEVIPESQFSNARGFYKCGLSVQN